jgi:hypothetical protein
MPFEQLAPEAVQYVNASPPSGEAPQQACPIAPQGLPDAVEQLPLVQVPDTLLPVQASPAPTQTNEKPVVPSTQQPPPLQLLFAQQGCPEAPQATAPPPAPPEAPPLAELPPPAAWPPVALPVEPPVPLLDLLLLQAPLDSAAVTNRTKAARAGTKVRVVICLR